MSKTRFSLKELASQMDGDKWPSCDFVGAIRDVVRAAEKHFTGYDG